MSEFSKGFGKHLSNKEWEVLEAIHAGKSVLTVNQTTYLGMMLTKLWRLGLIYSEGEGDSVRFYLTKDGKSVMQEGRE
jgi:hypothetical protein